MHNQWCGLSFLHDSQQMTPINSSCLILWNQGLVNLDFDDNKTRFRTNDYISSVIRKDDFQSGNHKDKSSQREIIKKNKTSKRSVFQDPNFIRSLYKVVGELGFSCITFFTYAPKSSKSFFILNVFQTCLKGFKLKNLVVEPKTAQPVEPDEEPINSHLNRSRSRSTPSSTSQWCEQYPVDRQLNRLRSAKNLISLLEWLFNQMRNRSTHTSNGRGSIEVQRSPAKH